MLLLSWYLLKNYPLPLLICPQWNDFRPVRVLRSSDVRCHQVDSLSDVSVSERGFGKKAWVIMGVQSSLRSQCSWYSVNRSGRSWTDPQLRSIQCRDFTSFLRTQKCSQSSKCSSRWQPESLLGGRRAESKSCWLTNPSVALGRWLSGWLRFCTVSGWVQLSGEFPALTLGTVYWERHWSDFCDFCAAHTDLLFSGGSFTNSRHQIYEACLCYSHGCHCRASSLSFCCCFGAVLTTEPKAFPCP